MRRERFEFSVSPPVVVYRHADGQKLEPVEEVHCEVQDEHSGSVIETLSLRRGELLEMLPLQVEGKQKLVFECPSRGLIGFRSYFATLTRGSGVMHRAFSRYCSYRGPMDQVRKGVLISTADGKTTTHALGQLEPRGTLFVGPGAEVYQGMIIGEHSRENDLEVNPVREKKLTNVRNTGSEERVILTPPRVFTIEDAIGYVAADELIEVTPKADLRLRKRVLDGSKRKSLKRSAATVGA